MPREYDTKNLTSIVVLSKKRKSIGVRLTGGAIKLTDGTVDYAPDMTEYEVIGDVAEHLAELLAALAGSRRMIYASDYAQKHGIQEKKLVRYCGKPTAILYGVFKGRSIYYIPEGLQPSAWLPPSVYRQLDTDAEKVASAVYEYGYVDITGVRAALKCDRAWARRVMERAQQGRGLHLIGGCLSTDLDIA